MRKDPRRPGWTGDSVLGDPPGPSSDTPRPSQVVPEPASRTFDRLISIVELPCDLLRTTTEKMIDLPDRLRSLTDKSALILYPRKDPTKYTSIKVLTWAVVRRPFLQFLKGPITRESLRHYANVATPDRTAPFYKADACARHLNRARKILLHALSQAEQMLRRSPRLSFRRTSSPDHPLMAQHPEAVRHLLELLWPLAILLGRREELFRAFAVQYRAHPPYAACDVRFEVDDACPWGIPSWVKADPPHRPFSILDRHIRHVPMPMIAKAALRKHTREYRRLLRETQYVVALADRLRAILDRAVDQARKELRAVVFPEAPSLPQTPRAPGAEYRFDGQGPLPGLPKGFF